MYFGKKMSFTKRLEHLHSKYGWNVRFTPGGNEGEGEDDDGVLDNAIDDATKADLKDNPEFDKVRQEADQERANAKKAREAADEATSKLEQANSQLEELQQQIYQ